MPQIRIDSLESIDKSADEFLKAIGDCRHIAFNAPMGAGKTTFISAICRCLGAEDEASSPTFSLVNEYPLSGNTGGELADNKAGYAGIEGKPVFHFDFYRIETPEEALDMGLDDYWDSGALCLMEWAENVEQFLPDDTLQVNIDVQEDGSRIVSF